MTSVTSFTLMEVPPAEDINSDSRRVMSHEDVSRGRLMSNDHEAVLKARFTISPVAQLEVD